MSDERSTLTDCYKEVCSTENLERAFEKARRGKTLKPYVIKFEENLTENLAQLQKELQDQTYCPRPLTTFILREPKTRKISKSDFRDRVVHHAICNIIEPVFDKRFIYDSHANRIGKGTFKAIERFDKFKRKVSQNHTIKCFVLKADIKHYFDSVDHQILLRLLGKRIKDQQLLWLINTILKNHKTSTPGKGMPLGNLTSQFFANVYLNELDQYVKQKLRAKYYIRYVDDFAILDQSKKQLKAYKDAINTFLNEHLALELHPDKSQILKLKKGIGLLGLRVFPHHKLIRKKNLRKFERKFEEMKHQYKSELIDREKVVERFEGWLAYVSHANTYKYRRRIASIFNECFPTKEEIKFTHVKKHEKFNNKIEHSQLQFSVQKTLHLYKNKKLSIQQIAQQRGLKEATVWEHIAELIEHHQLSVHKILSPEKTSTIKRAIQSPEDKLKEIKERIKDVGITYNEINCVLASVKNHAKEKRIGHLIQWYQRTNCHRKCYLNKQQRKACQMNFNIFASRNPHLTMTKQEFLHLFNNHMKICVLPEKEKRRYMSWAEFQRMKKALQTNKTSDK